MGMDCRHCGKPVDPEAIGAKILCKECAHKALQVLPTDPKERVHIYAILMKSDNPIIRMCAEQLLKDDADSVEEQMLDPVDRMFSPRGE